MTDPSNPFAAAFGQMAEQIARRVYEMMQEDKPAPAALTDDTGSIQPMRIYTADEVAEFLRVGMDGREQASADSVYRIDQNELPRVRRNGNRVGYLGINILCYIHSLPPVDVAAEVQRMRDQLMSAKPAPLRRIGRDATPDEYNRIL